MHYIRLSVLLLIILLPTQDALATHSDAKVLYQQGHLKQAEKLLRQQEKSEQVLLLLAKIQLHYELDEAEEWIEKAYNAYPNSPEVLYLRGQIMGEQASNAFLSAMSYAKKSLTSFEKAVELAPDQIKYRLGLLQFHLFAPSIAGGDKQQAIEQIKHIKQLNKVEGELADVLRLLSNDKEQQAEQKLETLIQKNPDVADYYYQAGLLYLEADDYNQAFSFFEQSLSLLRKQQQISPLYYSVLYQLGKTSVLSQKQLARAETLLQEYIQSTPKLEDLPQIYWAEFRLVKIWQLQGKTEQAKLLYKKLTELDDPQLQEQLKKQG